MNSEKKLLMFALSKKKPDGATERFKRKDRIRPPRAALTGKHRPKNSQIERKTEVCPDIL